jgi:hypothetical protein
MQNQSSVYNVDNLVIYQRQALVTITVFKAIQLELLPGFIPGSITFVSNNGNSLNFTTSLAYDKSLTSGKNYVELIDMNDRVITGIIKELNSDYVSIINDKNQIIIVNKWKQLVTKNDTKYNTQNIFTCSEAGTLRYMINTVSWEAMFNLFVESNKGILHLVALIHNTSNAKIIANNVTLAYGDNIIQNNNMPIMYRSSMAVPAAQFGGINKENEYQGQQIVTELLTYNLGKMYLTETDYNKAIYTNHFAANDLYIINYEYGGTNKTSINADYGYKIDNKNQDMPGGTMKIFTNSQNSTLLLGSVNVDRAPQGVPMEVIIGKTPRVRAEVYKQVETKEIKSTTTIPGTTKKIDTVNIRGTLINDTNKGQTVYFRDTTYNNDKTSNCVPKCDIKRNYLEWIYNIGPGRTDIDITYIINAEF